MTKNDTVAQRLAACVDSRSRCQASGNAEWFLRWSNQIDALVERYLPHGGGFDNGTSIDLEKSSSERLVFNTSFHHMNQHGCYAGWTDHTVKVTPTFSGIDVSVGGRNRNDIKDYIAETFHFALSEPIILDNVTTQYNPESES